MFQLFYTNRFKKDVKLLQRRGYNIDLLKTAIKQLEENGNLNPSYKPHKLSGDKSGFWEAHIKQDWLILWNSPEDNDEIWLTRTGTHSDLF